MFRKKQNTKTNHKNHNGLIPQDIIPSDDAFHGSKKHVAAEWWYFDAVFTNNYSLHIGCRTFSQKKIGLISPFLEIYKDGKLEAKAIKRYFFNDFQTSSEYPIVKLANLPIIEFDKKSYQDKKEWAYNLSLSINDIETHLKFIGTTKGWKFKTDAECWVVALPKASVTGEIIIKGDKMNVQGTGYHDHNWNYTIWTPLNYGKAWYWGKIKSNSLNISCAKIIKSANKSEFLAVINKDNNGYYPINPDNIILKYDKFIRNHRHNIPTSFNLKIDDVYKDIPINVDIQMDSNDTHYSRALFFPYWRHHVNSTGSISLGPHKETVDTTQIMEYLKFG